jgi:hypothetical protein
MSDEDRKHVACTGTIECVLYVLVQVVVADSCCSAFNGLDFPHSLQPFRLCCMEPRGYKVAKAM